MNTLLKNKGITGNPALWGLTFSAFGMGTTEFIIIGLLPSVAEALSIAVSSAGLLVTVYALGVAVGGPIFTALTAGMEKKKLLLLIMTLFILGNAVAIFAPTLLLLLLSRVITGMTHGVFLANASTIAGNLVSSDKKATAISLVFGGFLLSTVIGVPLGTYIATIWDWRMTFTVVSILGILGFVLLMLLLPSQGKPENILRLTEQAKALKNRGLLLILSITVLAYTGTFILFTYVSVLLLEVASFSVNEISMILLIIGLGVALGNLIGGRYSNQKPSMVLVLLLVFHVLALFVFQVTMSYQILAVITLFFFGFFAYSNVPALQLLAIQASERFLPGSGNLAAALNISAFNVGAASGSYIGGFIVDSPLNISSTPWVGGLFVVFALILGLVNWQKTDKKLISQMT